MIRQRGEKRIPFRKLILCKCGDDMHPGFTQDVSQHGIGIQTTRPPELKQRVRIALAVASDSIFLDGEVRWAHEFSGALEAKPREMGVYIHRPPAEYLRLVADCCDQVEPRFDPACQPLK